MCSFQVYGASLRFTTCSNVLLPAPDSSLPPFPVPMPVIGNTSGKGIALPPLEFPTPANTSAWAYTACIGLYAATVLACFAPEVRRAGHLPFTILIAATSVTLYATGIPFPCAACSAPEVRPILRLARNLGAAIPQVY